MTNKDALIAVLMVNVPDNTLIKALLDGGITDGSTYDPDSAVDIDFCAIGILECILSSPDITEGGYSIRYNVAGIKARLDLLKSKNGLSTGRPTIRGARPW